MLSTFNKRFSQVAFCLVLIACCLFRINASLSCLDESGNPVDRWVAIKQPKSGDYYYYTDDGDTFVKSDFTVTQTDDGMIMDTINQMYGKSFNLTNYIFGMYNDEPPPDATASSSYAHAKGVLITDTKQGFWLVHSMPHWPPTQNQGPGEFPARTRDVPKRALAGQVVGCCGLFLSTQVWF